MQRIRGAGVVLPIRKPFVARAHIGIGDERRYFQRRERGEMRFTVVARVGRAHRRTRAQRGERLHD